VDAAAGAYGVAGTPSAVLISPDGYVVGGPAAGAAGIRRLVDEDRPAAAPLAVHHVEGRAGGALGEPFPPLDLPGLDGPVRSADLRGEPTLVLLWNPGCGFCSRMLDDVRALEDDPGAPRLLLVSAGDEAANRAMGLRSPVALDGGFAVGQALGAQGTPSAVLVDGDGRIASPVAAGGPAVLALARAAVPQPA
jgi:protein-disulfide isomerase